MCSASDKAFCVIRGIRLYYRLYIDYSADYNLRASAVRAQVSAIDCMHENYMTRGNYKQSRVNMGRRTAVLLVALTVLIPNVDYVRADYMLDDSVGLGRMFDGIGGLSGGGVS